ncbi:thioredoxin [Bradyrhizobium sp. R2.2-H]|jgi:thiol-disulfide isomerase/thioredoxin|uniref:thioredoxin family protein n=1 Tax=unclassified Bradyrhizobium TaxID=2631580 RepID=UPI001048F468|nr:MULTISPECIES: thioredoxin family protein [unclassified Bradyrhizobium]TCU68273.1 thioredoxin [Bradyrhizobium sp. Y-H1]TCU70105.1 thioredoxin [Bradyrhizobium sp. R2.2-H]
MIKRTAILLAAILFASVTQSLAAERMVFESKAFDAALVAGKPILVHVTAPWCGECRAQKPIVAALAGQSEYAGLTIFDVDYDTQKDALRALKVQKQSTLVVFKDKGEITRAVGITKRDAIENLMKKAL